MKNKRLSVVNAVQSKYATAINLLAQAYGCGDNNLSCAMVDENGVDYMACHSFWDVQDYAEFSSDELRNAFISQLEDKALFVEALANLKERCVLDGDPKQNLDQAFALWKLSEIKNERDEADQLIA